MLDEIRNLLHCDDEPLLLKVAEAIATFASLDSNKKYHLAFSGGKDSHALLICFLLWKQIYNANTDNFVIKFADTRLETDELYQLIENIENSVTGIKFERVLPEHSYWYYQFISGYPVPDWRMRWCTYLLKIKPMNDKSTPITGRHLGESTIRDARLNSCSSGECGVDQIKDSYDPIVSFRNCDVWDLIFYADNTIIYKDVFNVLKSTYSQSENEKGSLRMGCFMCPVMGLGSLTSDPIRYKIGFKIRLKLEELRKCRRINSPRTKKKGAIYISDRRLIWQQLDKQLLLDLKYITKQEVREINKLIQDDYAYPKTYSNDWIDSEHKRLLAQTIYSDLPLFNAIIN